MKSTLVWVVIIAAVPILIAETEAWGGVFNR